ncbi:MAG: hypothetical protein JWR65_5055 [Massilia sp.]|jgi:hypothetical protein|nr:hypothetical protein [Massilia sp.]
MVVDPNKLHQLLTYCIDFAKTMISNSGEFHPFGAVLGRDGVVEAVGGYNGSEHPNPQDIYRILAEGFIARAHAGDIVAAAL